MAPQFPRSAWRGFSQPDGGNGWEPVVNPDYRPGLFLMLNTLERGGTERQFVTLAQGSKFENFQLSTGCLSRRGAFVESLPEAQEFSPGHSLFKLKSMLTRVSLARHMRHKHVAVAHAFDFYSNMMLI